MTDKSWNVGTFVWREIMSTDPEASVRFYGELFGWKFESMPMPGFTYRMVKAGDVGVGGVVPLDAKLGLPAHWVAYVSVEDVDAAAERARSAGGAVCVPPTDIPGVGRFSLLTDPARGLINAFRGADGDPPRPERPGLGQFCWEELVAADPAAAAGFYEKVFGWTSGAFPGGGDMTVLSAGEVQVASVMKAPEGVPQHWYSYVVVDDLGAARERAKRLGGSVLVERIDVPNVGAIGVVRDDLGAVVGLFEAPKG